LRIPYYQVNAFTSEPFGGNPAGVCPLDAWPPDSLLQRIAAENDLSETAFLVREGDGFRLRWMTPAIEVDLCGHATLAAAHVLFSELGHKLERISFHTLSGTLNAVRMGSRVELDFPSRPPAPCEIPEKLVRALDCRPRQVLKSRDYLAVLETEGDVRALKPVMSLVSELDCLGLIVTAPGLNSDFVSRFFAPRAGIDEDPVTGSAHCSLIPYWSQRLGKTELFARQISKRGGELFCCHRGERAGIAGNSITYLRGEIEV
jgi:predicted PhzF superfamily epimerase YddE/YHI9